MSDFDDLIAEGFAELLDTIDCPSVTHAGVTKKCVATAIAESKALRDTGYWLAFRTVCEFLRADFVALALVDRSVVTVTSADGSQTATAKVIGIEGQLSDGDPCVRVTLERADAPKATR